MATRWSLRKTDELKAAEGGRWWRTSSMIKTTSIITTHHGDESSAELMSVLFELTCSSSPAPMRNLMHLSVVPSALSSTEVVRYVSKLVRRPAPNLSDHSEKSPPPHPVVAIFSPQVCVLTSIVIRPRVVLLIWVKPQRLKAEWASIEKSGGKNLWCKAKLDLLIMCLTGTNYVQWTSGSCMNGGGKHWLYLHSPAFFLKQVPIHGWLAGRSGSRHCCLDGLD